MRLELNTGVYEVGQPIFVPFEISGRPRDKVIEFLEQFPAQGIEKWRAEAGEEIVCLGYLTDEDREGSIHGRWVNARPGDYKQEVVV